MNVFAVKKSAFTGGFLFLVGYIGGHTISMLYKITIATISIPIAIFGRLRPYFDQFVDDDIDDESLPLPPKIAHFDIINSEGESYPE
jgi:hypothetical protein